MKGYSQLAEDLNPFFNQVHQSLFTSKHKVRWDYRLSSGALKAGPRFCQCWLALSSRGRPALCPTTLLVFCALNYSKHGHFDLELQISRKHCADGGGCSQNYLLTGYIVTASSLVRRLVLKGFKQVTPFLVLINVCLPKLDLNTLF